MCVFSGNHRRSDLRYDGQCGCGGGNDEKNRWRLTQKVCILFVFAGARQAGKLPVEITIIWFRIGTTNTRYAALTAAATRKEKLAATEDVEDENNVRTTRCTAVADAFDDAWRARGRQRPMEMKM